MTEHASPVVMVLSFLFFAIGVMCFGQVSKNLLKNPNFEEGTDAQGVPWGWARYGGGGAGQQIKVIEVEGGKKALLIEDGDSSAEIGIVQSVPVSPGLTYEASVKVRSMDGASAAGAYLQLRFRPSDVFTQVPLVPSGTKEFEEISVRATAPANAKSAMVYFYTHREPTPKVMLAEARLISGVEPPPPPPLPPPEPIPPQYTKLKDLHITTDFVKDGKPNVVIVAPVLYRTQATRIQAAIEKLSGVKVPIVGDDAPEAGTPIMQNVITLGNRSTNKLIRKLYDLFYTLLDLKYPGPEGYEVRSLHDPFGNGANVIFVGGSDMVGVEAGTNVFIERLKTPTVGWLMEIKLGKGLIVPKNLKDFEIWEASAGYRSTGYFGWNSISKRMAMYYMTGDPFQAREVVRLAFPDKQAFKEITEIDEERIENKNDPLAGPYHYNAHMMILFWDLIEESPVFTDEERLKITNAFARQLNHRKDEGIYRLTQPPVMVGSRHGQWSAISLYCLGRYFQKYYPNPIWAQCVRGAELAFHPLHKHAWVSGENDNLFWYNTAIAPILTYMVLTGDRKPLENGVLHTLLRGQEILASGRERDWALNSAALDFLHKAAYLTQDGRWLFYRQRTGLDTNVFRLGQSFWPEEYIVPKPPTDLVRKWSIYRLPKPMWQARNSGLPYEDSFQFGSFRTTTDAKGDFILIDGFNGASRNPYHCFAILALRLAGNTLLEGYNNQVLVKADGMVEPIVAMDAALRHAIALGQTAALVADVPKMAYCNWRRMLVQRIGRYALIVDQLTSRTESENVEVQIKWEGVQGFRRVSPKDGLLYIEGLHTGAALPPGWRLVRALDATCTTNLTDEGGLKKLDSIGIVLLRATSPGSWLEMPFRLDEKVSGEVFAEFVNYEDRGTVRVLLDEKPLCEKFEHYAASAVHARASLGKMELLPGEHRLRVEVVGKRPRSEKCYVGLVGLSIKPEGVSEPPVPAFFTICNSEPLQTSPGGRIVTMEWTGPMQKGHHRIFFSLLTSQSAFDKENVNCVRVSENAAALATPTPALAVVGDYDGVKGGAVLLAEDHAFGWAVTQMGLEDVLLAADSPVDVDWDYTSGELHVISEKDNRLRLALSSADGVRLDGNLAQVSGEADGLVALSIPAGQHVITQVRPADAAVRVLSGRLSALLKKGREERIKWVVAAPKVESAALPLQEVMSANIGGSVTNLVIIPGPLICAAEGKTVHVLAPNGREVRRMDADGTIRVLHWWPEHKLLLAGCVDEKVIAFDETGSRKWVFVSEMDPAVFRAAKQYWFKSAPGHEGIHGIYSGVFIDGKSQAFVGSACTLEIIDENGKLVKRLPVFWGCGSKFQLIDVPDGSRNLLIARQPTDGHALAVVNNRKLEPHQVGRSFEGVPAGHTYVGGWACMSRKHIFYDDLDGDGKKEVASEINGTWNRVTIWNDQGVPLYNAQFGPGQSIPAQNIRDVDVADLDGDGKKEIVVGTFAGMVVVLDCKCQKVWAKRMTSPPTVLACVNKRVFVGCEEGRVIMLDAKGYVTRTGKVNGRPTCIDIADDKVILATDNGEVKGFASSE